MREELQWTNLQKMHLHAINWATAQPKAVIAMVHGQGEHIGRYHEMAEWYNRHQIAFVGFDLQGYGKSEGRRGHARSLNVLINDIELLLQKTEELYPDVPIFLYGHSMGGNLTLNYTLRHSSKQLRGQIATAPWIRLAFNPPPFKESAGRIIRYVLPTLTLPNGLAVHFLSHDPQVVEMYKFDPLVHDKISATAGIFLIDSAKWLDKYHGEFPIPLLLMHGGGDKITSIEASREFAARVQGQVTFKEWPDLYHEIHNEKEKKTIFHFTLNWIEGVLATTPQ